MVMSNQKPPSERIAELLHEVIDIFRRGESTPHSPLQTFAPAKTRRALRRSAERLRRGQIEPRFKNLYTAEQLADIFETTARRDEVRQQSLTELLRLGREIKRLIAQDPEGTLKSWLAVFEETSRLAREQGPGSEAAARYRQLQRLSQGVKTDKSERRRQKSPDRGLEGMAHDPSKYILLIPAELLESAPEGEAVIPFPAEDSGRCRILIRIGLGASSWIGNFECGLKTVSTLFMMPDGKHLFVSANGAGYILEEKTRKLVERTGTEIVGVSRDEEMTLFIVNHNDVSFEAFGPDGRLWTRDAAEGGAELWCDCHPDAR
jgi:hypothetical protein